MDSERRLQVSRSISRSAKLGAGTQKWRRNNATAAATCVRAIKQIVATKDNRSQTQCWLPNSIGQLLTSSLGQPLSGRCRRRRRRRFRRGCKPCERAQERPS